MPRKKILITIDWFLPGTKSGGPVRSYANMIAHLGVHYDFYIITRDTDYCSDKVYENVQSNAWNQLDEHTSVYYFSNDRLNKENFKKLLDETSFDIVYINGIYSWNFSILPLWLLKNHKNVIVAARGMLNPQAFSVKGKRKKLFLRIAKFIGLYKNVKFHATNEDEANHIIDIFGKQSKIHVAPNLPRLIDVKMNSKKDKSKPTTFANIARISTEKGTLRMIDALHDVSSEMVLDIFGPIYDEAYWKLCLKSIKRLPSHVIVSYKGILASEAVPSVLERYDFFVLLSEGENFGHAILEAFMAGCPVIISDQTPWKQLERQGVGWDIDMSKPPNATAIFEKACSMSNVDYQKHSDNTKQLSREFSKNPDLLMLNLELFNQA
ncbi:MAG: glycosyltransferase family 4 protein [Gelidibacter sp.]